MKLLRIKGNSVWRYVAMLQALRINKTSDAWRVTDEVWKFFQVNVATKVIHETQKSSCI